MRKNPRVCDELLPQLHGEDATTSMFLLQGGEDARPSTLQILETKPFALPLESGEIEGTLPVTLSRSENVQIVNPTVGKIT